ncbi:MAG TPA: serine/threonine-protein kinase [Pyrinomonadaceae bacterium]|jgi:serine/threonine-protein kinase
MTPERWKRIEELFNAAVELSPPERAPFLDEACRGDVELRREVALLLAQEDNQDSLFSTLIGEAAGSLVSEQGDGLTGRRIGAYRITGAIGAGGMAEVYRAVRDDDQYQKQVAVKLVKRGMVSSFLLSRFRSERQILASLDHPHIARMLDGGTTEDGLPYFIMECVEGQPITDYCEANRLSVKRRLQLFRDVCAAVQHAHRNLIIHRDLKPSNILVTKEGVPKLLDFGIAKLLAPEVSPVAVTVAQTETFMRLMTPDYASPEQVRGEQVTTATDVYSLGAVLFELLTGQRAHQFKKRTFAEIERVICHVETERPSLAVERRKDYSPRLRRELSGDLDNIVLMAMRKEPERRYSSVEQLSEDLRRHLEGRPVRARQDTVGYRMGKFVRRHKAAVSFAVLLFMLSVGVAVTMTAQAARIARERDRANHVTEFLVELFEVSTPSTARGNTVTAREILDKGASRIEREMAGQPEVQATLMDTMAGVYRSLGLYDSALPLLEKALALRQQTLGAEHVEVAESMNHLARVLLHKGNAERAEALFRESLEMRRRLLGAEHARVAESMNDLGEMLRSRGRYKEAEPLHRAALEMRRKLFGAQHADVAYSLHNLAAVLDDMGRYAEAEPLYREALVLKRRLLGEDHPSVANTLNNLALALRNKGDDASAEPLFREAIALRRKVLGPEHPDLAVSLNNLGSLLVKKGDLAAAEQMLRESLEMKRKLLGPTHPSTAISLHNLADALETKGDCEAAEPLYKEALEVTEKTLDKNHWRMGALRSGYGACLTRLGRLREAEELLVAAYTILKAASGDKHERTQKALTRLIALYEAMNNKPEAERHRALLQS